MWRTGLKDPFSSSALGDVIMEIIWGKSYVTSFLRKYPELLNTRCNYDASPTADAPVAASHIESIQTVKSYVDTPLKLFLRTDGA